jgi:16S rRNA (adenine1518-N6/adenine1519-N6)-dimethyltransferase
MVSARSPRQRELGQNFLVDRNILDVIGRLAELAATDVVLEVGGGPGVLSTYLAPRVSHLHVVEVDERLRERLTGSLVGLPNVTLHFADALHLELAHLAPAPSKSCPA